MNDQVLGEAMQELHGFNPNKDGSVELYRQMQKEHVDSELCVSHGIEIKTMAFKGTGFCSIECRKLAGDDVSSVGTIMFVTTDERKKIMEAREKNVKRT